MKNYAKHEFAIENFLPKQNKDLLLIYVDVHGYMLEYVKE